MTNQLCDFGHLYHLLPQFALFSKYLLAPTQVLKLQVRGELLCYLCVCLVTLLCPTLCDPMDCSPLGSSSTGILQARLLEWVAYTFSRGPS